MVAVKPLAAMSETQAVMMPRVDSRIGIGAGQPHGFEYGSPKVKEGLVGVCLGEHPHGPCRACCSHNAPDATSKIKGVVEGLACGMAGFGPGHEFCGIDSDHGFRVIGINGEHRRFCLGHGVVQQGGPLGELLKDLHGGVVVFHTAYDLVSVTDGDMAGVKFISRAGDFSYQRRALNVRAYK